MTPEEFKVNKERIEMYETFDKKRKKLLEDKGRIENGILGITAAYQREITFYPDNELENKIIKVIVGVYEQEINSIENVLKAI